MPPSGGSCAPPADIVVGTAGTVGALRKAANGDIRLIFGDDEATAVPVSWLLEKIAWLQNGG